MSVAELRAKVEEWEGSRTAMTLWIDVRRPAIETRCSEVAVCFLLELCWAQLRVRASFERSVGAMVDLTGLLTWLPL